MDEVGPYRPTPAEMQMAHSINMLIQDMMHGQLAGIAICAITHDGQPACFYLNKVEEDVLREPLKKLRVMYETNRNFNRESTAPRHNRSFMEN